MTKTATGGSNFEALLAEIQGESETLAKSIKDDDAAIAAAAAEGAKDGEKEEGEGEGEEEGEGKKEVLGKSLTATDPESGEPVEAIDATDLLKSLMQGQEQTGAVLQAVAGALKQQGDLIKSLSGQVRALSTQGRGRKAVLSIAERPGATEALTKSLGGEESEEEKPKGINGKEFLAKALEAADAGRIHYRDASHLETLVNRGIQPPEHLVKAVMGDAAAA